MKINQDGTKKWIKLFFIMIILLAMRGDFQKQGHMMFCGHYPNVHTSFCGYYENRDR
jgi:hypothetical protein